MKTKFILAFAIIQAAACFPLVAQEKVVDEPVHLIISANKQKQEKEKASSSVILLDQETIKKSQRQTVEDLLRTVPELDVIRSGGSGGNTSIFIRGANAEHTLILLNGIELNNPASTSRLYNFANLSLADVDRIEILLGSQGSLYGSDAIGGVISIFTKEQASGKNLVVSSDAGSQSSFNNTVSAGTGDSWGSFNVAAERRETAGFSAQENSVSAAEKDAYQSQTLSSNLKLNLSDTQAVKIYGRFNDSAADIDDGHGVIPDDPNRVIDTTETLLRSELQSNYADLGYNQIVGASYSHHQFEDQDYADQFHSNELIDSEYKGRLLKFDYLGNVKINPDHNLTLGLETERESADSSNLFVDDFGAFEEEFHPEGVTTNSALMQLTSTWLSDLSSTQGVRFDSHEISGDEFTYRIAPRYELTKTSALRSSFATGFKAPSLYQLYSSYGNQDLAAEESRGWEVAYTKKFLADKITFDLGYFENKIKNLIDFDPQSYLFSNTNEAKLSGISASTSIQLLENLTSKLNYTYLDTENLETQSSLLRRARQKVSASFNYQTTEKLTLGLETLFTGNRYDNDFSTFPAERKSLASYTVVNIFANYQLNDSLSFKARVENLFDRGYQEVLSYNTPGLLIFGGLEIKL